MTALCWIKNDRIWKQYVQHRVEEIRSLTTREEWGHCPGDTNPADLPSRGLSANDLSTINDLVERPRIPLQTRVRMARKSKYTFRR